jgi:hypothetical protein
MKRHNLSGIKPAQTDRQTESITLIEWKACANTPFLFFHGFVIAVNDGKTVQLTGEGE